MQKYQQESEKTKIQNIKPLLSHFKGLKCSKKRDLGSAMFTATFDLVTSVSLP